MGRYSGKTCRLICMLTITASFFLVEITVGYIVHSLALVADSFHMLSDVVALIVGLCAVRISKRTSKKNTFGWARAEVLGALFNAVFLVALCFSIFVEALERLIEDEPIEDPQLMLIVGGLGLLINVVGLFMFHGHGHSHGGGGHGHSHGGDGDVKDPLLTQSTGDDKARNAAENNKPVNTKVTLTVENGNVGDAEKEVGATPMTEVIVVDAEENKNCEDKNNKQTSSSAQLNMRGVFLHVLGDALGSVIVIISALVIWFVEDESWKYKLDPAMSIVMVIIILSTTVPLLKESSLILLQTVPTHIVVDELQNRLLNKVQGVIAIHEFHVWQLTGDRIVATAHIRCKNVNEYKKIAEEVKEFFHDEGIHSTTIQPEFEDDILALADGRDCALECGPEKTCFKQTCCAAKDRSRPPSRAASPSPSLNRQTATMSGEDNTSRHSESTKIEITEENTTSI